MEEGRPSRRRCGCRRWVAGTNRQTHREHIVYHFHKWEAAVCRLVQLGSTTAIKKGWRTENGSRIRENAMTLRVATFNVENLYSRPVAMNHLDNADGQPVLDDFHRLNSLLREPVFTQAIKDEIETLVDKYRLLDRTVKHDRMILREVRGKLWTDHQDGTRTWEATGADDFLGWVELVREAIDDRAIRNTARVIAEGSAGI